MAEKSRPPRADKRETQGLLSPRITPEDMGARIRAAREAKGWSQAKLAGTVGTTQQTIEKIEAGRIKRTSYLTDILSALELPYERNIFNARLPLYSSRYKPPIGDFLRLRREALGLDRAELARFAGTNETIIELLEGLKEQPAPTSPEGASAYQVFQALAPLEQADPAGEPYAHPSYYVSALPAGELDFPYFRMGEEKGIHFEYFAPSPWDLPRTRGFFCLTVASWVLGFHGGARQEVKAGAKIYARPVRVVPNEPVSVVAFRSNVRPADIDEVVIGTLTGEDEKNYLIDLGVKKPLGLLGLARREWSISQIHMATLQDLSPFYHAATYGPPED